MSDKPVWGIHMAIEHGTLPKEKGYVAIGWPHLGDLGKIEASREAFKITYATLNPQANARSVSVSAGILYRFAVEMQPGDIVVYPSKVDRTINIGRVTGPYEYRPNSPNDCPNVRPIEWLKRDVPRDAFSQSALNELGSFVTLFRVQNNVDEIYGVMRGEKVAPEPIDDVVDVNEVSIQAEISTEDFIIKRLKTAQTAYQFEHFVAHLLKCMGYHTRVTKQSGDGGVDIIAHKDELGVEPPIIKVQCKQMTGTHGAPEVQQLFGAIERDEFGLFVTLGYFAHPARVFERSKSNLRLIDGETLIELIYAHYEKFEPRYQALLPLRRAYLPSVAVDVGVS